MTKCRIHPCVLQTTWRIIANTRPGLVDRAPKRFFVLLLQMTGCTCSRFLPGKQREKQKHANCCRERTTAGCQVCIPLRNMSFFSPLCSVNCVVSFVSREELVAGCSITNHASCPLVALPPSCGRCGSGRAAGDGAGCATGGNRCGGRCCSAGGGRAGRAGRARTTRAAPASPLAASSAARLGPRDPVPRRRHRVRSRGSRPPPAREQTRRRVSARRGTAAPALRCAPGPRGVVCPRARVMVFNMFNFLGVLIKAGFICRLVSAVLPPRGPPFMGLSLVVEMEKFESLLNRFLTSWCCAEMKAPRKAGRFTRRIVER